MTRFAFVVAFRCCSAFGDGVVDRDDLYIRVHPCFVYEDDRVLVLSVRVCVCFCRASFRYCAAEPFQWVCAFVSKKHTLARFSERA